MENRSLDIALAIVPTLGLLSTQERTGLINSPPTYVGNPTDLSSYDLVWDNLAGQRPISIYHMHTAVMPSITDVLQLINGHHSSRSRAQIKAKILNRLVRGGSPFGTQRILAQKISIHGYAATYSETFVSNLELGKRGSRKSHGYSGQISKSHEFLAYFVASEANEILSFYDSRLNSFYNAVCSLKYSVYENSVAKYLFYDRSENFEELKRLIENLTQNDK